ncbi:glycosyltransferase family 2 protein [Winogradskyella tangerina]|uniref:glycosyltransferase family 2 protein n=1 Tax=Winogradskyella tangerina TaxID=2023240 RepID=UPI000DBE5B11|nr:glycosyltransferase [Winogradskyella tangerina]
MITIIAITSIIVYLILIGGLVYGFDKVETFKLQDLEAKNSFSVIIPFRNEIENLPKLLRSILSLKYPQNRFEIILVDDDSTDGSAQLIQDIINETGAKGKNIRVIKNQRTSNSPKKDAINSGITVSKNEWIVTTDADCILHKYWLDAFDEIIQNEAPNCIVAPVTYHQNNSFFSRFQTLDFLSLQAATIGGFGLNKPFLCNGANFAYRKEIFLRLKGFKGNSEIASGDDIFLLEKFKGLDKDKVVYLKSDKAIVRTLPVTNFGELIEQRLRWASKTSRNPNGFSKLVGVIVLLGNTVFLALPFLLWFNALNGRVALSLLVIKLAIDLLLLFKVVRFFGQENVLLSFISSSLLYPFFSVYIVLLSFFKSYRWKGREFRK